MRTLYSWRNMVERGDDDDYDDDDKEDEDLRIW